MDEQLYEKLADILDNLPNSFPRTESGIELKLLKKVFSLEEAEAAVNLTGEYEPVDVLAERSRVPEKKLQKLYMAMAKKEMVWFKKTGGQLHFRIAPFMVGIYEGHLARMDHEFAHLFEHYMLEAGKEIMKYDPALQRALPAVSLSKCEWILPYDDVKAIVDKAKTFRVRDCICRVQQGLVGKGCDAPRHNCLILIPYERPAKPDDLTKEEVLAVLDEAEKFGLVHCVSNHQAELTYICNCCGCCCGVLRGITEYGLEKSVAYTNYYAVIDPEMCTNCGTCIERCQVNATVSQNDVSEVVREKCIGCGLCVTGCPDNAAQLVRKSDNEITHPPIDFADWEDQRKDNREM